MAKKLKTQLPVKKKPPKGVVPDNFKDTVFKPGQCGNPNGRPRKWVSALAKTHGYKKSEVLQCITALLSMTLYELKQVQDNDMSTALECVIAKALTNGQVSGDLYKMEVLLTRAFGAPKQVIEIEEEDDSKGSIDYSKLSDSVLIELAKSIKQR